MTQNISQKRIGSHLVSLHRRYRKVAASSPFQAFSSLKSLQGLLIITTISVKVSVKADSYSEWGSQRVRNSHLAVKDCSRHNVFRILNYSVYLTKVSTSSQSVYLFFSCRWRNFYFTGSKRYVIKSKSNQNKTKKQANKQQQQNKNKYAYFLHRFSENTNFSKDSVP